MIRLISLVCGFACGIGFVMSGLYLPSITRVIAGLEDGPFVYGLVLFAIVFLASVLVSLSRIKNRPFDETHNDPGLWANWKAVLSAVVFGIGWGIAGYFPTAAVVAAGLLLPGAPLFLASVLVGMVAVDLVTGRQREGRLLG